MRKLIGLIIIVMFVFSLMPLAFAEEGSDSGTSDRSGDSRTETMVKEKTGDSGAEVKTEIRKIMATFKKPPNRISLKFWYMKIP